MYWKEAQERQREETETNAVFLPDNQAAITGCQTTGWLIVTSEQAREARTEHGVTMMLEELNLPALGWT